MDSRRIRDRLIHVPYSVSAAGGNQSWPMLAAKDPDGPSWSAVSGKDQAFG